MAHNIDLRNTLLGESDANTLINNNDPDENYFDDENNNFINTPYLFPDEVKESLSENLDYENISCLHLNIRSLNANFENFKYLLQECKNPFNIVGLSETWSSNDFFQQNSNFDLPNYESIHMERKTGKKGGGVLLFIKSNLNYKYRNELSVSDCDSEILTIEILNKKVKHFIISVCYRPPSGDETKFNENLNKIFQDCNKKNQNFFILGDFNMNSLNYESDNKTKYFFNNIFSNGAIPLINRPTRITKDSATIIDNILTNVMFNPSLKTGIIKSSIIDHFLISCFIKISKR